MRGGVKLTMGSNAKESRPGGPWLSIGEAGASTGPGALSNHSEVSAIWGLCGDRKDWLSWAVQGYMCVLGSPGLAAVHGGGGGGASGCPDRAIKGASMPALRWEAKSRNLRG